MTVASTTGGRSRNLVLAAMIFAVSMTFIDQTIVSIAAPQIQRHLGLTSTGVQWAINAYLMSLAALFAFGGRLADTVGHRAMVTLGVIVFAAASAMCGLTPKGELAEAWIVAFRILQGAGGAIMFPAALAIVVQTFALRERGRALALFFGIAGGLTAIGPLLGGFLTEWTWRAIFWVNIPVAIIALVLIVVSKPTTAHESAPMDYRGMVLIAAGVALSVFGFQQSLIWGWSNPAIGLSIAAGVVILLVFGLVEVRTPSPLMKIQIFRIRAFLVENLVLGIAMLVFVPVFFFASEYAQIALGDTASQAGVFLLYFFIGFVVAAQIGGRILDRSGAKRPVVVGCALAAVGFYLWAGHVTRLSFCLSAVGHHRGRGGHGVHARPGQHRRRQPGLTSLLRRGHRHHPDGAELRRQPGAGHPRHHPGLSSCAPGSRRRWSGGACPRPGRRPRRRPSRNRQGGSGSVGRIPHFVKLDFAYATRSVLYVMAGIMAVAAVVAFLGLQRGLQEEPTSRERTPVEGRLTGGARCRPRRAGPAPQPVADDLHHALKSGVVEPRSCPPAWQAPIDQADHLVGRDVAAHVAGVDRPPAQLVDVPLHLVDHPEALRLDVDPGRTEGLEQIPLGRCLTGELAEKGEERRPGVGGRRIASWPSPADSPGGTRRWPRTGPPWWGSGGRGSPPRDRPARPRCRWGPTPLRWRRSLRPPRGCGPGSSRRRPASVVAPGTPAARVRRPCTRRRRPRVRGPGPSLASPS